MIAAWVLEKILDSGKNSYKYSYRAMHDVSNI